MQKMKLFSKKSISFILMFVIVLSSFTIVPIGGSIFVNAADNAEYQVVYPAKSYGLKWVKNYTYDDYITGESVTYRGNQNVVYHILKNKSTGAKNTTWCIHPDVAIASKNGYYNVESSKAAKGYWNKYKDSKLYNAAAYTIGFGKKLKTKVNGKDVTGVSNNCNYFAVQLLLYEYSMRIRDPKTFKLISGKKSLLSNISCASKVNKNAVVDAYNTLVERLHQKDEMPKKLQKSISAAKKSGTYISMDSLSDGKSQGFINISNLKKHNYIATVVNNNDKVPKADKGFKVTLSKTGISVETKANLKTLADKGYTYYVKITRKFGDEFSGSRTTHAYQWGKDNSQSLLKDCKISINPIVRYIHLKPWSTTPKKASFEIIKSVTANNDDVDTDTLLSGWWFKVVDTNHNNTTKYICTDSNGKAGPISGIEVVKADGTVNSHKFAVKELGKKLSATANLSKYDDIVTEGSNKYGFPKQWKNLGGRITNTTTDPANHLTITINAKKKYSVQWTNHWEKKMPGKIVKSCEDGASPAGYYFVLFDSTNKALTSPIIVGPTDENGEANFEFDNPSSSTIAIIEMGKLKPNSEWDTSKTRFTLEEFKSYYNETTNRFEPPSAFEIPRQYEDLGDNSSYYVTGVSGCWFKSINKQDISNFSFTAYVSNTVSLKFRLKKTDEKTGKPVAGAKYGIFRYTQGTEVDLNADDVTEEDVDTVEEYLDDIEGIDAGYEGNESDEDIEDEEVEIEDEIDVSEQDEDTSELDDVSYDEEEPELDDFEESEIPDNIVAVVTTDENGEAKYDGLMEGRYYVQELEAPDGWLLDDTQYPIEVSINPKTSEITNAELNVTELSAGKIIINKKSSDEAYTGKNPIYSLENAKFTVKADGEEETYEARGGYCYNAATGKYTEIDDKTVAEIEALPLGKYTIVETVAPKGFRLSTTTYDIELTETTPEKELTINDEPEFDPIALYMTKVDADTGEIQGGADLSGAVFHFKVYERHDAKGDVLAEFDAKTKNLGSNEYGFVLNQSSIDPDSWVSDFGMTLDDWISSGEIDKGEFRLPVNRDDDGNVIGTSVKIEEVTPPEGYLIEGQDITFTNDNGETWQPSVDGKSVVLNITDAVYAGNMVNIDVKIREKVIKGGVAVEKQDYEFDGTDSIADLSGVRFSITNRNENAVEVDGQTYEPGEVIGEPLVTDYDKTLKKWIAKTSDNYLPYGTYEIKEILANDNYNLTDSEGRKFTIEEDGEIVTRDINDDMLVFKNEPKRTGFAFNKFAQDTKKPMQTVWVVENTSTKERHVVATDKDGNYSTANVSSTTKTNANDKLLSIIDSGKAVDISEYDYEAGIWFGKGLNGKYSQPKDNKNPLPLGTYKFTEVRSNTNVNYQLYKEEEEGFVLQFDSERFTDIEDINDLRIDVKTTAVDGKTDIHVGLASDKVTIKDTVKYDGLIAGRTYKVKGTLMDADEGYAFVTGSSDNYKNVEASSEFTPESKSGTVVVTFNVDSNILKGKKSVVFEKIYEKDTDNLIAFHEDLSDEGQSVYYPSIKTTALSEKKMQEIKASKDCAFNDTVEYKNLLENVEYKIKGTLIDIESNDEALDADGREITAEKTFTPDERDGKIVVPFKFDGTNLGGHKYVVFEQIYENDNLIAVHADINDEAQSIYIPDIKTKAVFDKTENNEGVVADKAKITDTVYYKGLIPGNTYKLTGVLMNKASNKPLEIDGKQVISTETFTPSQSDGYYKIMFEFDASSLAGQTVVAFESLERNDVELAVHADINDESQSIHFPKIGTKVNDGAINGNELKADDKAVIRDKVMFNNLQPGETYVVRGVIIDKSTGKVLETGKTEDESDKNEDESSEQKIKDEDDNSKQEDNSDDDVEIEEDTEPSDDNIVWDESEDEIIVSTKSALKLTAASFAKYAKAVTGDDDDDWEDVLDSFEEETDPQGDGFEIEPDDVELETFEDIEDNTFDEEETFEEEEEDTFGDDEDETFEEEETFSEDDETYETEPEDITEPEETTVSKEIPEETESEQVSSVENTQTQDESDSQVSDATDDSSSIKETEKKETTVSQDDTEVQSQTETKEAVSTETEDTKVEGTETPGDDGNVRDRKVLSTTGIKSEVSFVPTKSDGYVMVDFEFDASLLAGKDVVVYEYLERNAITLTEHEDINDENQTAHFPEIGTTLTNSVTKTHEALADTNIKLVDDVEYKNLTVGEKYIVKGKLVNKDTSEDMLNDENKVIEASAEFVPDKKDGVTQVTFEFSGVTLKGKTVVAFETLERNDIELAVHADINDEAQMVTIPKIGTTASSVKTNSKAVEYGEKTVIRDKVNYENLTVGTNYTLSGQLMDKKSNKAVGDPVEVKFNPDGADGSMNVDFIVDTRLVRDATYVAFETLHAGEYTVAKHEDIDDVDQTVYISDVDTKAHIKDSKLRKAVRGTKIKIDDDVTLTNLIPSHEYTLKGIVVDTKSVSLMDDYVIKDFTAQNATEKMTMTLDVDTIDVETKKIVVYEYLYDKATGALLTPHTDVKDDDQTITLEDSPIPPVQTGLDRSVSYVIMIIIGLLAVFAGATAVFVYRRRKLFGSFK